MMKEIYQELISLSSEEIAVHSQRFFKTGIGEYGEGDIFLGIRVPVLRKLSKKYKALSLSDVITLLKDKHHEIRLFALFILTLQFEKAKTLQQKEKIYDLYLEHTQYINNWDLVDSSAHKIIGSYLLDKERIVLYELAKSRSLWERRIAVIATFWFIRASQYDDTLQLAKMLLNDKEDLIHKAVGWMLRELGKREKSLLITFLEEHHKQMPRVMLRYALEKCTKDEKKRYMS